MLNYFRNRSSSKFSLIREKVGSYERKLLSELSHDLRLKVAFMLLFLKKEHLSMLLARNYEAIEDC